MSNDYTRGFHDAPETGVIKHYLARIYGKKHKKSPSKHGRAFDLAAIGLEPMT